MVENVTIPPMVKFFLENLLYVTEKQSDRRRFYKASDGNIKPIKHVELGLCTKGKIGSRKLITWLNRLGHCLLYHEVNLVETGIAEEQIASISRAEFVTFVYDNGDLIFAPMTLPSKEKSLK